MRDGFHREEKEGRETAHSARVPICPYRANILCGIWRDRALENLICPTCGWNPEEEDRRKNMIRQGNFKFFG